MSAPKIYLNENLSWKIAKAMREYGYDVVSSYELGMNTEADEVQFEFAVIEKRAILTNNFGDFVRLCEQYAVSGKDHYGVNSLLLSTTLLSFFAFETDDKPGAAVVCRLNAPAQFPGDGP